MRGFASEYVILMTDASPSPSPAPSSEALAYCSRRPSNRSSCDELMLLHLPAGRRLGIWVTRYFRVEWDCVTVQASLVVYTSDDMLEKHDSVSLTQ